MFGNDRLDTVLKSVSERVSSFLRSLQGKWAPKTWIVYWTRGNCVHITWKSVLKGRHMFIDMWKPMPTHKAICTEIQEANDDRNTDEY